jgi:flagellar protein FliS
MMTSSHAARAYQQNSAFGAGPVHLIVLLYDAALRSLHRAVQAIEAHDIEKRTRALNHVLEITAELQGSLDFERGGEVARNLSGFYAAVQRQVLDASVRNSRATVETLIAEFTSLREAWAEVDRAHPAPPAV